MHINQLMLKIFLPVIVLIIGAYYGFVWYPYLPASASIGITYLIYMMALIVAGLSVRFSRSMVFFYVFLIMATNLALRMGWVAGELTYALLSSLLPLMLVGVTVLPERGLINVKAIPSYAVLVVGILIIVLMSMFSPEWLTTLLLQDWAPARYFDWTGQAQSTLAVTLLAIQLMLTLVFLKPSLYRGAGFGILLMLAVQLHFGATSASLNVFSGVGLLMCLFAIMQETWRMAYIDELTGLPGRRALTEKFQRIGSTYTVAMLDVDHFKKFNDNFGHDAGDAVLRMIAAQMSKVPGGGLPYRYGGEEFTVIFSGKLKRESRQHLEDLRAAIAAKPFVIRKQGRRESEKTGHSENNETVKITVSIGCADSTEAAAAPWDVLKLADKALYRAKERGRNCIAW